MSSGRRVFGLVLLLVACGSDVAWDPVFHGELDHKLLRTNPLHPNAPVDKSSIRCPDAPRVETNGADKRAGVARHRLSRDLAARGTLLSLGCLLSV